MIEAEQIKIIQNEAETLFQKLGMEGDILVEQNEEEGVIVVSARTEDPKLYIGEKGQTLFEIQHVLKLMLRRKIDESFYLSLDINDYKKNKEEYLRDLAQTAADEVTLLKKEKELPPMPPAERKIIHMALASREDIVSESVGEGAERRVIVRVKS